MVSEHGFSLIECLVSILLLTFLLVGGMSFYTFSNDYLQSVTSRRIAADLANSRMEIIKSGGYDAASNLTACSNPSSTSVLIGQLPGSMVCCQNGTFTDVNATSSYKAVKVKVQWNQPNKSGPWNVTLDSFIAEGS
jgi:prepilin-type N-terminal cleavage/methylation domain-containing protein